MSNKKEFKKVEKVNIDFIEYVNKIYVDKLDVTELNKEVLEKLYNEIVSLKFSNLVRVSMRNNRDLVVTKRDEFINNNFKEMGVKKYRDISKKLLLVSSKKRVSRYI